jgi:hypothetical protein
MDELRARHGTTGQAKFVMAARRRSTTWFERADVQQQDGLATVLAGLPGDRRRTRIDRDDVSRFVFEPEDVVLCIGQDGLVANVAKYLDGQLLIGVNPDPARYDGVLCRVPPERAAAAVAWTDGRRTNDFAEEPRVMARVALEDGQVLYALNEVFLGHASHQSARYSLEVGGATERQSSSGIIVRTGTGATGWAKSIARQRARPPTLPTPGEAKLAWFVREPFPSVATGVTLEQGVIEGEHALGVVSEMGERGVIFGDGIEQDALEWTSGQTAIVRVAQRKLRLVVPAAGRGR